MRQVRLLQSLRVRIMGAIMATLVLTVGGSYTYIIQRQSQDFVETIKEQAAILTHAIVRSLQHEMRGSCLEGIQGIFERIGIMPDIESLRIFDENGTVTKSKDPAEVGLTIEDIGYEIFKANVPSTPYRGGHGYNAFCMVEPIRSEGHCRECHSKPVIGILELCLSMEKTDRKIAQNRRFLFVSAVGTILFVGVFLSLFLTVQVNRPIEKLARVMHQAEEGNLGVRGDIRRNDELGALAASFNDMIRRLSETRKEVERYHTEQLIRADRLATIGELAAGVAHEIKNPLAGISAAIQVLADDFEAKDPRRRITEQIVRQADRMDKTIRDLLNFAQPLQAELSQVDVNATLETSLFICLPNPGHANITIVKQFATNLPALLIDGKHLQQVFINIILNAVQAMPGGGTLTVATALRDDAVRVSIGDTGKGVAPEAADKIFTPFFTTKTEGTGLGLSITKRILEIHRASVSYESAPGGGTVFHVDLPLVAAPEGA